MDQVKAVMRYHHYAYRTEQSYCDWIYKYILFHNNKHPDQMGGTEIEAFLSHLALSRKVSASTQRQALNALIFLYHRVLEKPIREEIKPIRAKRKPKLPVVMTQGEVKRVLGYMKGTHLLMAQLLYGGGLRLMECVRMRIQDIDFERKMIYVNTTKGGKHRITLLPDYIIGDLHAHIEKVKEIHEKDISEGYGETYLPESLARKDPHAAKEFRWQYVFPSKRLSKDPRTGVVRRHHVLESGLQKAVKTAVQRTGIPKRITCHTFRHSFATHLLENGVNIHVVQELMGHSNVKTTEIYTHVMEKDISAVRSPLDLLEESETSPCFTVSRRTEPQDPSEIP